MTAITLSARTIVTPGAVQSARSITLHGDTILAVDGKPAARTIDLGDVTIIPGLIDIHIHGREECDVMDADPASLAVISTSLARHGVTSFLATTVTSTWDRTIAALRCVGATRGSELPGARMLGAYSEGSFFNAAHKGAHNEAFFLEPSPALIDAMIEAAAGKLRVLALAPEVPGGMESLRHAVARGVKVVIGHTDATYDQTRAALAAGGSGGVHVFNGMRGIHHREPGCAGAVLLEQATVEVIADGVHLHPAILRLIARLKSPEDILLISDCMCAGGLDDGTYRLGEMDVVVRSGVVRTEAGGLAGSTLTLDQAVRMMAQGAGVAFADAVHMASQSPARFLGMDDKIGTLAPGKRSDLAISDPDGTVRGTLVAGRIAWLDPAWHRADELAAALTPAERQGMGETG